MAESQRLRELERLLKESEERGQRERQRADEAERGRQEDRQQVERERQADRQRVQELTEQTRPTTFDEYLTVCHGSLFSKFRVGPIPGIKSKRFNLTNPRDKWCPTTLKPWSDFLDRQRRVFGLLYDTFPADRRAFESRYAVDSVAARLSKYIIADEKRLETFLHFAVEGPVSGIVDELKAADGARDAFALANGIIFENHPHVMSDISEEVVRNDEPPAPPSTPGDRLDLNQLRPDQICVFRSDAASPKSRTMLYVLEYKPPHKLTAPHLRLGLRRPFDIHANVINCNKIPTDPEAKFQYHAEQLTASAITQTYHYMIESGLEYGLLTTGEMTVFLNVDWDDPSTLLYHLAEPSAEVAAHPNHSHLCTAVGQHLAFTLMALESSPHRQEERLGATAQLKTWTEDFTTTLNSIPLDQRCAPKSSSGYQPVSWSRVDRSPYSFRVKRKPRKQAPTPEGPMGNQVRKDSSDDDSGPNPADTPSPAERRSSRGGLAARRSERIQAQRPQGGGSQESTDQEYCTQKCLLGLVRGDSLDPACPNLALHKGRHGERLGRARHPLDHGQFQKLLWKQLQDSLDDGITPLDQGGARGVLFKVTLLAHGYTFVAKGTVRAFVKDLEHEAAVYRRLQASQGIHVPVFLGAIDLRSMNKIYYFAHRVYIIHLTFLSWGGHRIYVADFTDKETMELEAKALRSLRLIHAAGVVHKDVRSANMLRNDETQGVMMIDFERASLLQVPRRLLFPVVPSKRNREPEMAKQAAQPSKRRQLVARALANEIGLVSLTFGGGGDF